MIDNIYIFIIVAILFIAFCLLTIRSIPNWFKKVPVENPIVRLMVDIETLGIKPGCVILSIAVVPIDEPYNYFYKKISVDGSMAAGFHKNLSTVAWWADKDPDVYAEATDGTQSPEEIIKELTEYIKSFGTNIEMWSNPPQFDMEIIKAYYDKLELDVPWSHYQERCYRTLSKLFKNEVPRIYLPDSAAHNALNDATIQAEHAKKIFKFIKGM